MSDPVRFVCLPGSNSSSSIGGALTLHPPLFPLQMSYCAKFHSEDDKQNIMMCGCNDKKIYQFDMNSGDMVQEYDQHLAAVNTVRTPGEPLPSPLQTADPSSAPALRSMLLCSEASLDVSVRHPDIRICD